MNFNLNLYSTNVHCRNSVIHSIHTVRPAILDTLYIVSIEKKAQDLEQFSGLDVHHIFYSCKVKMYFDGAI